MHNEFMAFINDDETAHQVQNWAEKQGFPADTVKRGGPDLFASLLESDAPPKLALVDFDGQEQPIQLAARLVSLCGPTCNLVALGSANDVTLYRSMMAAGLSDYLVKPVTAEILTQTMLSASQGEKGGSHGAPKEARIVVILGVRGGVGASTVATNTAWLISHDLKQKSALLDLDLQFGTSALALDIEPGHGLRDVVSSPQRVDGLMIAGAMVSESTSFAVLSAEESIEDVIHVDSAAIAALLKEIKSTYNVVIVDMPRHMIATQKRILATAHEVVLVTEMSLVGIRDTLRIRTTLKGLGSTAKITQVATRVSASRPSAVDEAAFAKGTQAKIDFVLPDDHKNMTAANNAGKMLGAIAPSAALTKAMLTLAKSFLATQEDKASAPKKGGGIFGGLFKSAAKEDAKA
jgi:pilus assembly protein CpaE